MVIILLDQKLDHLGPISEKINKNRLFLCSKKIQTQANQEKANRSLLEQVKLNIHFNGS